MFIVSNKRYLVGRADGTPYLIPRGYIGEIPEDVAKSWLVQAALKDGSISTPESKKDAAIEKAVDTAKAKAKKAQKDKEQ